MKPIPAKIADNFSKESADPVLAVANLPELETVLKSSIYDLKPVDNNPQSSFELTGEWEKYIEELRFFRS